MKRSFKQLLRKNQKRREVDFSHQRMVMDLHDCISLYGFGFSQHCFHYLASTVRQFAATGEWPKVEDTHLWRYFEKFHPQNLYECLFVHKYRADAFECLWNYRDPQNAPMPWATGDMISKAFYWSDSPAGDYGPRGYDYIVDHYTRLITVTESILRNGYQETLFRDSSDSIRGLLLKYGRQVKLLVIGGNHRAAALAGLGYETIPVEFHRRLPHIVDVENASNWPCVKNNLLSNDVATEILSQYFRDDGVRKAEFWGIV